ncbi:MAG: alpha-hydroxy acid oxidase [Proteobacteria bacterium]|nr:alpha-hydroxy acid oxidase [Pseudomonadota bacterium]
MPEVLNDVSEVDTSATVLGHELKLPVMLAPIGSLQVFDPHGGASAARAAADSGVISIASSVCTPDIEEIAAASGAPKIYQLYVRGDDHWLDEKIQRVIDSGYVAFCLTVDTAVVSRRERDIAKRVVPTSVATPGDFRFQASMSWKTVARIRRDFEIPLILKGITRVDDALKALDHGVSMIYVSNHGGRQLDQSVGTMTVLPDIVKAVNGQAEVAVDGGFYRGTDILKAIAMGAGAVGLGRLEGWALAAGGVPALNRCLTLLRREIAIGMALCGVNTLSGLNPGHVIPAEVVSDSDLLSAFPLLDEGY